MSEIEPILRYTVLFCFAIPLFIFVSYGSILLYYNKIKKGNSQRNPKQDGSTEFEPTVSIVIPTHNEKSIISKRIENLFALDYPHSKLEMIFVDDSSDSTPSIIQGYAKDNPCVHLIRFNERIGYSPSMIAGVKSAKGEIVVFGDAGSFLDSQAIKNFAVQFQDPSVGVVAGADEFLNSNEQMGKSETLYQKLFNFLRMAESKMDSTLYVRGEATAVRSSLVKDLENAFETFDTTTGLFVRQKGYKTIYAPKVKFYEYAPLTHSDRIKQKTIRAANLIKVIFRFRHLMFNRKYGKYGSVVLPMNFAMLAITPIAILIGLLLLVPLAFLNLAFSAIIGGVIGSILLISLLLSRHLVYTFIDFECSLIKALYEVVIRRKTLDKIEKVESTRRTN